MVRSGAANVRACDTCRDREIHTADRKRNGEREKERATECKPDNKIGSN